MSFTYATSNMLGVDTSQFFTVNTLTPDEPGPIHAPGTRAMGTNGGEVVLVQNGTGAALAVGQVVFIDTAHVATLLSTANDAIGQTVGVVLAATPASTSTVVQYCWVQVKGFCAAVQVAASCAANVRLNTTATAGQIDDDGTAGAMVVFGINLTTARGGTAGTAPAVLNYPQITAVI